MQTHFVKNMLESKQKQPKSKHCLIQVGCKNWHQTASDFALLVELIPGLSPAMQAAALSPIKALKDE